MLAKLDLGKFEHFSILCTLKQLQEIIQTLKIKIGDLCRRLKECTAVMINQVMKLKAQIENVVYLMNECLKHCIILVKTKKGILNAKKEHEVVQRDFTITNNFKPTKQKRGDVRKKAKIEESHRSLSLGDTPPRSFIPFVQIPKVGSHVYIKATKEIERAFNSETPNYLPENSYTRIIKRQMSIWCCDLCEDKFTDRTNYISHLQTYHVNVNN